MSGGGLGMGLKASTEPWYGRLVRFINAHWDEQQRVQVLGVRDAGGGVSKLRALASRATSWVRVHVQSTSAGGSDYDPLTFEWSAQRDVRADRQLDEEITRNGADRFFVWLIPEVQNADGSFTSYDGDDGPDQMSFADLGV